MRVEARYDLIVIGDQLSGLFLAAGAAQRGMKVLVLEESNFPTVLYEAPTGRFLGDFLPEPAIGLHAGSPADKFLQSLGLYQDLDQQFPCHEPPLQIVSSGFRLDVDFAQSSLAQALGREVDLPPADLAKLASLIGAEAPGKKSFSQMTASLGLPVGFECLGPLQTALYGSLLPDDISFSDYREIWSHCAKGVRFPLGGRGALKERLLSRIQVFGGYLRRASHVEEIVFEKRQLAGVLLSSFEGFVRSKLVVGALGASTFAGLLPAEMRVPKLEELIQGLRPKGWKLGFTLLVPESAVPEGMGSHVALVDPESNFGRGGLIQLQVFPKDFYGGIPPRFRAVLGRVILPFESSSLTTRVISTELKRALHRIETVMPFLNEQPYSIFPDPNNLDRDPVFQRYYRFPDLSFVPASLQVFENSGVEGELIPLDWTTYGLEGLALCSRDIRPLYGVYGEILSAMELLEIWDKKKAKPSRRRFKDRELRAP